MTMSGNAGLKPRSLAESGVKPFRSRDTINKSRLQVSRRTSTSIGTGLNARKSIRKSIHGNQMTINDFEIGKKLGKGKFGKVYCARHKKSGFICALKIMDKKELINFKVEKQFRREVEIQSSVKHVNCIKLYGHFHDADRVYLILEFAIHGELYKLLKKKGKLDEVTSSRYIYQISDALSYLHDRHIIHRDIKPENILLGFDNTVKISDFGWSVYSNQSMKRTTMCGTLDYLPPEMVEAREHNYKVDVWALGILMYEFLVGKPPFEEEFKSSTYKRIAQVDLQVPSHVSPEAKDLIQKLLRYTPEKRINLKDIETHPWIVKNKPHWDEINLEEGV
ncbi:BA75_00857T0 [Komagataella pastoris]|uniref:Aurora kinase n=1 Tax=Komagataella pastoris TaxID=4922 RepID=A0A1B2J704_PICPA|nr:BA75_00857T0 [Komagataella pastoris]